MSMVGIGASGGSLWAIVEHWAKLVDLTCTVITALGFFSSEAGGPFANHWVDTVFDGLLYIHIVAS